MFNRFTEIARRVIVCSKEEARRFNHDYIGTEHLLLGLLREQGSIAASVLYNFEVTIERARIEVDKIVQQGSETKIDGDIPFTQHCKKLLEASANESRNLKHNYIGTEHLLLGLISNTEFVGNRALINMGLDLDKVREEILAILGESNLQPYNNKKDSNPKTPALDAYGRNLNKLAKEDKLDPVIGRSSEVQRILQILSRRTKNNPVLLGEAGVGKTAVIEGLAQRIVKESVPEILKGKSVVMLDLALMVAGTKYRGQFEERIKNVMEELKKCGNIILFIDEIHTLVGAGAGEGTMDAANILKPALARGEIQCIGATTLDEYRKYIEKDSALERRFQSIQIEPPSVEESIEILNGLKCKYEAHHKVKYSDEAIEACVKLSDRYISNRFLPDKAIDILDESGAKKRLENMVDTPDIEKIKIVIDNAKKDKDAFILSEDFEKATRMRDIERENINKLTTLKSKLKENNDKIETVICYEDIASTMSQCTNIPLSKMAREESNKLLKLEDSMSGKVIGQEKAINAISRAIKRSRSGIKDPRRPIGSFVFLGSTGVGKTLLAQELAKEMFGGKDALIQIDMSEYMDKFNVSRLVGAPPGYIGYEEGGQLTEKVRRKPYSVVLLDEIEKAHPDVFNLLLQVFEEGHLTDSLGRKIDFKNTIILMTSNVGSNLISKVGSLGFNTEDSVDVKDTQIDKNKLMEEVRSTFKPEFLNRIDETIIFETLSKRNLKGIVKLEVNKLIKRLLDKDIEIQLSPESYKLILDKGFSKEFGARPLKRIIQGLLEDTLAEDIISGKVKKGSKIFVNRKNNILTFTQ